MLQISFLLISIISGNPCVISKKRLVSKKLAISSAISGAAKLGKYLIEDHIQIIPLLSK